jgi:hypothetical protein
MSSMKPTILGQNNCGNCAHHGVQNGQMVCQFNPPTASPVFAYIEVDATPRRPMRRPPSDSGRPRNHTSASSQNRR